MHYNIKDETANAQAELLSYLEAQANAITIELTPLVRSSIKVERVGFTRKAQ